VLEELVAGVKGLRQPDERTHQAREAQSARDKQILEAVEKLCKQLLEDLGKSLGDHVETLRRVLREELAEDRRTLRASLLEGLDHLFTKRRLSSIQKPRHVISRTWITPRQVLKSCWILRGWIVCLGQLFISTFSSYQYGIAPLGHAGLSYHAITLSRDKSASD